MHLDQHSEHFFGCQFGVGGAKKSKTKAAATAALQIWSAALYRRFGFWLCWHTSLTPLPSVNTPPPGSRESPAAACAPQLPRPPAALAPAGSPARNGSASARRGGRS